MVATIAPVVVAVAIFAVTASPFALLFAALGPVTAVASLADSRWSGRRLARREAVRFAADLERVRGRVDAAQSVEIATLHERTPAAAVIAARSGSDSFRWKGDTSWGIPVTLGIGLAWSAVELERPPTAELPEPITAQLSELEQHAGMLREAPVVVDAALGIGIAGPLVFRESLARALAVQLAWALPPSTHSVRVVRSWDWPAELPHRVQGEPRHSAVAVEFVDADDRTVAAVARAESTAQLPGSCAVVVSTTGGVVGIAMHPERGMRRAFRPGLVSRETAVAWAIQLRADAAREGLVGSESPLPTVVQLESLWGEPSSTRAPASLACEVALTDRGPFSLDLVLQGPHAVVGGTTGSGKSELLIAWVLSMAHSYPPDTVTFLLVDFKGGSAFGALRSLPHTVGIITDLDEVEAARALESMRAELRFRERALADAGARSIEHSPGLPRLVIVVDEFAAMLADHPDLHALFADIASRGRSLGVHLVLCTQRPAGVVRDGVLANADLRVSLRVNNRADSIAVVATDAAAVIQVGARGRAVVSVGGDDPTLVQFAIASPEAHERARTRWHVDAEPRRPWCEPLPDLIAPTVVSDRAFGLIDRPHEQRRVDAVYDPRQHGHLLVLGTQGSGKTHALEALATPLGPMQRIAGEPDRAWDALLGLVAELDGVVPIVPRGVLIDDVDALVPRFSPEHRPMFVEQLCRVLREGASRGIRVMLSAQRLIPELQGAASLVPARLMLRHASRQEWVLAGGDGGTFQNRLPPGGGLWNGERVQVVMRPLTGMGSETAHVDPLVHHSLAVVTGSPSAIAAALAPAYRTIPIAACAPETLQDPPPGTAIVGDPEEWQSRWGALASLRGTTDIVFAGCSVAEFRALSRSRQLPPPLAPDLRLVWLLRENGTVGRALLPVQASAADSSV
ncbi:hypothetical protein BH10ACT7_BH10ACT7_12920 [soil metagenome]